MGSVLADLTTAAPLWIPAVAAFIVLLLGVAGPKMETSGSHLLWVSLVGVGLAGFLLWGFDGKGSAAMFSGALLLDGVSATFGFVALVGTFLSLLVGAAYLREHELARAEFYGLLLLSAVGMVMFAMAGDLMILFIGLETMSLGLYVLAGFLRAERRSQEAALKYFVYGAFASGFILFGIALLYGETGRLLGQPGLRFDTLERAFRTGDVSALGWTGALLLLSGLAFKVAAVPFHMWAPDVYEGSPTPSTAFMAVGVKAAAFAGLFRVVQSLFNNPVSRFTVIDLLTILAIATMVVGNLLAIRQQQIKRMLAYSSIAHAGYALVGLVAHLTSTSSGAVAAVGLYLLGYSAMTVGAFAVVIAFERSGTLRRDISIDRLRGVGLSHPALGLAMTLFMLSLAGIPPTAGFFGKLAIFGAAIQSGHVLLVVVAALASAVGAYYYLRVLVSLYMRSSDGIVHGMNDVWLNVGLATCGFLTVALGMLPDTYLSFARRVLVSWLG